MCRVIERLYFFVAWFRCYLHVSYSISAADYRFETRFQIHPYTVYGCGEKTESAQRMFLEEGTTSISKWLPSWVKRKKALFYCFFNHKITEQSHSAWQLALPLGALGRRFCRGHDGPARWGRGHRQRPSRPTWGLPGLGAPCGRCCLMIWKVHSMFSYLCEILAHWKSKCWIDYALVKNMVCHLK